MARPFADRNPTRPFQPVSGREQDCAGGLLPRDSPRRMVHKLPGWVWFGAAVLSFIAGTVNAVGFLGFQHQGVTHLTGTTALAGAVLFSKCRYATLYFPAALTGLVGLACSVYRHHELRRAAHLPPATDL